MSQCTRETLAKAQSIRAQDCSILLVKTAPQTGSKWLDIATNFQLLVSLFRWIFFSLCFFLINFLHFFSMYLNQQKYATVRGTVATVNKSETAERVRTKVS